jgi:signal transduction histidine kinase
VDQAIRLLFVEDNEDDAILTRTELQRAGYAVTSERVETAETLRGALDRGPWDLVVSDWSLPRFTGLEALTMIRGLGLDVPIVVVSGTVGEETAVSAMRTGANDFIVKGQLKRLVPVVERELREAATRRMRQEREHALRTANSELDRARIRAQEESAFKSKFLASMSHELRTPLNAIIGFSELLDLEVPGALSPTQKEYVRNVLTSGEHLLTLIDDILDISKVEAGRMELRRAWQSLGVAVDAVRGAAQALADKRGVALELQMPSGLPDLFIDVVRVKQILFNLLSNAIKYTEPGGKVTLRARCDAGLAFIEVSDTGIGIRPEDMPRLFREFEQIHAGALSANGTGLGLALTRKLVELHSGRITVESEAGRGSTFTVELPLLHGADGLSGSLDSDDAAKEGPCVLVIEDDSKAADLLGAHLRSAGLSVAFAHDAETALAQARLLQPVAITVDLLMPGVDGWGTLSRLKADPETASIPIVVISVVDEPNRGLVLGAVDHLVKPVSRENLLRSLANVGVVFASDGG